MGSQNWTGLSNFHTQDMTFEKSLRDITKIMTLECKYVHAMQHYLVNLPGLLPKSTVNSVTTLSGDGALTFEDHTWSTVFETINASLMAN